ncbi:hypothetical protein Pmani_024256 [Petrolisthes manimaculis]|uniref:Uncharacterized protein n=1 Tax=Petrolisthes manimaculis TaxID=1843537 RepID=A0AAE1P964_9EUCA|nr:hypothetical protein Pmani_024256 [Petrolisthes manimaculis]
MGVGSARGRMGPDLTYPFTLTLLLLCPLFPKNPNLLLQCLPILSSHPKTVPSSLSTCNLPALISHSSVPSFHKPKHSPLISPNLSPALTPTPLSPLFTNPNTVPSSLSTCNLPALNPHISVPSFHKPKHSPLISLNL